MGSSSSRFCHIFHWVLLSTDGMGGGSVQVTWMSFALTFLFCVKVQGQC